MLVCESKLPAALTVTAGDRNIQRLSLPAMLTEVGKTLDRKEIGVGDLTPVLARPTFFCS
jgi:hypothetical protein